MELPHITKLMEIETLWEMIDREVQPLPARPVPLGDSLGLLLAEPIFAESDQPPFDRSAMDGFFIGEHDTSRTFRIVGEIRPGHSWKGALPGSGETLRIFTGAEVPGPGRVLMQERFAWDEQVANLRESTSENQIRTRGSDCKAGAQLLSKGAVVTPGAISVLAANGNASPRVIPHPTIAHLTTGDEIVPPEARPGEGQIRNSNGPMIRAMAKQLGNREFHSGHTGEERELLAQELAKHELVDLLLISGGASVGKHDHTRVVLESRCWRLHCSAVNSRPGKPLIFATRGTQVAFGIPGNPVSHFVCFHLFIQRAIARLTGKPPRVLSEGCLAEFSASSDNRVTWWPSRVENGLVHPLPWKNSGDLTPLALANALVRFAPGNLPRAGAMVQYMALE